MLRSSLLLAALSSAAHAGTVEDIFGASARTTGMGGAGTAVVGDASAAHYNTAALTGCGGNFLVEYRHTSNRVDVEATGDEAPELEARTPREKNRVTIGTCIQLPFDLTLGALVGISGVAIEQETANERPTFANYGINHDQPTISIGLGWRATESLSIGIGLAVLVNTQLPLTADLPALSEDPNDPEMMEPIYAATDVSLGGRIAPRFGITYAPSKAWRLGAAYRGPIYHHLEMTAKLTVDVAGVIVDAPILIEILSWFSPREVSAGVSADPSSNFSIAADVTWYQFSELNRTTYPFINVKPAVPGTLADLFVYPKVENPGWKDVFAARLGGELHMSDDRMRLRGGFGFRNAAVEKPGMSNVNILDGGVLSFTSSFAIVKRRTPGRRRSVGKYDVPDVSASAELLFRLEHMPKVDVEEKQFRFGGQVYQFGVMGTLGW